MEKKQLSLEAETRGLCEGLEVAISRQQRNAMVDTALCH